MHRPAFRCFAGVALLAPAVLAHASASIAWQAQTQVAEPAAAPAQPRVTEDARAALELVRSRMRDGSRDAARELLRELALASGEEVSGDHEREEEARGQEQGSGLFRKLFGGGE